MFFVRFVVIAFAVLELRWRFVVVYAFLLAIIFAAFAFATFDDAVVFTFTMGFVVIVAVAFDSTM